MVISFKDIFAPSFWQAWNDFLNQKYTDMWFTGGRGCIAPDTLIDTPSGKVCVKDFKGGEIFAYDGKVLRVVQAAKPLRYTKEKLYRVTTKSKRSIVVTNEHMFLTPVGWRRLKDISIGSRIFSCRYSDLHSHLSPTSPSSYQSVAFSAQESIQSNHSQPCFSCTQKVSSALLGILYEGYLSKSSEDVLHSMRKLLGFLYCYFQDSRLCDVLPQTEEDTFLDIVQQLADVPAHSHENSHKDGLGLDEKYTHYAPHECRLSMQDCHYLTGDICYEEKEIRNAQMLFESLLGFCEAKEQSQKTEDPDDIIQQVSQHLLSSIENLGSSEDGLSSGDAYTQSKQNQECDSPRMLFDMLRHKVHDESLSASFQGFNSNYIINDEVVSIVYEKDDFYYDLFVPFYNNYIADGIVNHNSTKSSFVTMCIVLGMIRDAKEAFAHKAAGDKKWMSYLTHAIVYRKIAADLRISVYNQFIWSIEKLGLTDKFKYSVSPLRITYKATGQMIDFRGLDDPIKSKSIKAPFGYYKYNFFEELNQFDGMEEIRSVRQSIMRGSNHHFASFAAFNPPESSSNWCNFEAAKHVPGRMVYHSDYRSVPRDWLGETFFQQAEILRLDNERAYRNEYLGEATGNGGAIFPNLVDRRITDEEIAQHHDDMLWGCDFGLTDPTVLCGCWYSKMERAVYCAIEVYKSGMLLDEIERRFRAAHFGWNYIMADSASPQMIMELENRGLPMLPVTKYKDSIKHGLHWLRNLRHIYIDQIRCPNGFKELSLYEFEKLKGTEQFTEKPVAGMDHYIDSLRYATMSLAQEATLF